MKVFVAVVFLATFVLLAESSWQHLQHRDVMPVYPKYAAQKPIPGHYYEDSVPQPVHVPVDEQHNRIIGGSLAEQGQFPWQVYIIIDNTYFCGGSLIQSRAVLTAANCVFGKNLFGVRLGATRLDVPDPGSVSIVSANAIVHPGYNPVTLENDITIIRLPLDAPNNAIISPVQLPPPFLWDITGEHVIVSGWGKTSDGASGISIALNYVEDTVLSNDICANTYGTAITTNRICTSTTGGKGPCSGDAGGPLVYLISGVYNLVGVVSFGHVTGCEGGFPAVFSRVTSYLDWIASVTGGIP